MNLLRAFAFAVLFAAIVALPVPSTAAAPAARPKINLVMPDDVSYGDCASVGNPITRTPSVAAFEKESLLFTQFHVSPTRAPTRSALKGGKGHRK